MTHALRLAIAPLTREAFAPFGEVFEAAAATRVFPINAGTAQRHHDLLRLDTAAGDGHPVVSLVRAQPVALPLRLRLLERHPLGSQAWLPLEGQRFVVVVAPPGAGYALDAIRAFVTDGRQGVNYARGVWHHPLLTLERAADFLVLDRDGPGDNCDEIPL
ncbi:ureidoglycolate lyase, partial [Plasticicumulans lactativorans]